MEIRQTVDHATYAVTFDFHNTLAHADSWFALEVHDLVPAFLVWYAADRSRSAPSPDLLEAGRARYRALRKEIVATGQERDAVSCLLTVLPALGLDVPEAEIETGVETLMRQTLDDGVAPLEGAVETVRQLADEGVPLGIVSSAIYPRFLDWTLERFGIRDAFRQIVTSAGAGYYKSDPRIYHHSASLLGTSPDKVVHIGDSYAYDVESARVAGHRTVWLRLGRPLPEGEPPDLILDGLTGAAPAIFSLLDDRYSTVTTTAR